MKVIIAGGRDVFDYDLLLKAISQCNMEITEVVSGGADGADALGERWARENNIKCTVFPAMWNIHGRAAGPIRNREMAEYAEGLIALWDAESRGTKDMISQARKNDLEVFVQLTPRGEQRKEQEAKEYNDKLVSEAAANLSAFIDAEVMKTVMKH